MISKLKKTVNQAIKETVSGIKESVAEHAAHLTEAVKERTTEITDSVKESVKEHATHLTDAVKERASDITDSVKESVKDHAAHFSEAVKDKAGEITDNVKDHAVHLSEAVKDKAGEITDNVKDHAAHLADAVKEKTLGLIDDWLKIFPSLAHYGLKSTAFGMRMGMNTGLECELTGKAKDFSVEKIEKILEEVKGNTALTFVFKAIKNTYSFHHKTGSEVNFDKIFLRITVQLIPEVVVYLGEPKLT